MTPQPRLGGVIVYVLKPTPGGHRVLFLKRSGGMHADSWWPVSGTPEPGETGKETALRELKEETDLEPERLLDFGMEIPHLDPGSRLEAFVAMVAADAEVQLNYEHSDYQWVSGDEAVAMVADHSKVYLSHLRDQFVVSDGVVSKE